MLILLNAVFIVHFTCVDCKLKRKKKQYEKRMKKYKEEQEKLKAMSEDKTGLAIILEDPEEDE